MKPGSRSMTARRSRLWGRCVVPAIGWSLRSANICPALYRRRRTEASLTGPLSHDIYVEIATSQAGSQAVGLRPRAGSRSPGAGGESVPGRGREAHPSRPLRRSFSGGDSRPLSSGSGRPAAPGTRFDGLSNQAKGRSARPAAGRGASPRRAGPAAAPDADAGGRGARRGRRGRRRDRDQLFRGQRHEGLARGVQERRHDRRLDARRDPADRHHARLPERQGHGHRVRRPRVPDLPRLRAGVREPADLQ